MIMNEPRVYKQSPFLFIFMLLIFGILFVGLVASMGRENWYIMIPFGLVFGVIFLIAIFSMTSKATISEDEISAQNLLGTKTLRWSEINHVSGRGSGIKLHDFDRGMTVAPNPQLPGYPEIVEWIGVKRPDLFSPQAYSQLSKSWFQRIFQVLFGLLLVGIGFFGYMQDSDTFFPFLIFALMGIIFSGAALASPQSITLQGNSMMIGYLFKQKTLSADEISSVDLRYTQTRNGKRYFATINLVNSKTIRISGFGPNLPVVYLVLKNWHAQNTESSRSPGRF
jgi:ABC-type antimicrobial peptide transport system permease subunit